MLGKRPKTGYYTEANGKLIRDVITLNGDDWLFNQHQIVDKIPTENDFKRVVADYLSFRVKTLEGSVIMRYEKYKINKLFTFKMVIRILRNPISLARVCL